MVQALYMGILYGPLHVQGVSLCWHIGPSQLKLFQDHYFNLNSVKQQRKMYLSKPLWFRGLWVRTLWKIIPLGTYYTYYFPHLYNFLSLIDQA